MNKYSIFLLLIVFGVTLSAQQMRGDGAWLRGERMGEKLNLTSDQQTKFNEIKYEHQEKMIDMRSQLQKNRLEIRKMMNENNVDEKKLLNLIESNNKIHNEMRISSTEKWLAVYKILDNDQKQIWTKSHLRGDRFGEYKDKSKGKMKGRFHNKRG